VPVDGFWSISLYNANGYFVKNQYEEYSLNNFIARKGADGSIRCGEGEENMKRVIGLT
jgi:hypothetical protein